MPELKGRVEDSKSLGELVRNIKKSDPKIFQNTGGIIHIELNQGREIYYPRRDGLRIPLMRGDIVSFVLKRPLTTGVGFFSDEDRIVG